MDLNATLKAELADQSSTQNMTRRTVVPSLEEILYEPLPVLDHGFVRVIDYMGDDAAVVQAARVSYGKGTKQINQDKGLIFYLLRHRHTTPFEMCEIKLHIKLPIFVARQWIRHRTASVNEYSARYSILDREFYLPEPQHLAAQSTQNRQGRDEPLPPHEAERVLSILKEDAMQAHAHYIDMLNEDESGNPIAPDKQGLTRELARMTLPVNYYTQWYWKIDLHNFMHFLALRADAHAQYEIRVYAEAMLEIFKRWMPLTYEAFEEYVRGSVKLSKTGMDVIRRLLAGEDVSQENSKLGAREWRELMEILGR